MKTIPATCAADSSLKAIGFRCFLTTQFLGAFNDNAFKVVVSLLAVNHLADEHARSGILALAGVLFTLPFILFSSYAGGLADRYSKRRVMIFSKVAEIAVMGLGAAAFVAGSIPALLTVIFLMGAQSAFFSPAKYGSMPEMLADGDLPRANGYLQLWTFLAIIAGTALGGQLSGWFSGSLWQAGFFFMGIALLGTVASLGIPKLRAAAPGRRLRLDPRGEIAAALAAIRRDTSLGKCVAATSFFWFMSALFQVTLLLHAKERMGLGDRAAGWLLASLGLGIGLGSVVAGHASRRRIEFGLTPIGAMVMAACSVGLFLSGGSFAATAAVLLLLGFGGGFYCIPVVSHLQKASPPSGRGQMMAFRNLANFSAMLLSYPAFWLMRSVLGISSPAIFLIAGVLMATAGVIAAKELSSHLLHTVARALVNPFYRLSVAGRENIPATGGALVVANHVSYPDAILLQMAVSRFVRFLMARSFFTRRWLNPLARLAGAIPVSAADSPREIMKSLRAASRLIQQGEVVCIFAEGALTRTGHLQAFNRGLELIMRGCDAPIIPAYLHGLWGAPYSYRNGKLIRRPLNGFPVRATIMFGKPLPAATPAAEVRQAVAELGAECEIRNPRQELLGERFLRQARRHPFRRSMADQGKAEQCYAASAVRALALSRYLARRAEEDGLTGVLLPSSTACALANLAIALGGGTAVNLNYTLGGGALNSAITKCRMQTIITSRQFVERLGLVADPRFLCLEDLDRSEMRRHLFVAGIAFALLPSGLLARVAGRGRQRQPREKLAAVLFSSGSTGDPKGVMLSHANLNANVDALARVLQLNRRDRVLGNLPCFHSFGLLGGFWFPMLTGRSVVYCPNPLDFAAVGEACRRHGATVLITPPTFLAGILRRCCREQLASLRHVITGAERLSPKLAAAFEKKFGIIPREGYGCTELSPAVALNVADCAAGSVSQAGTRAGTIGLPLPGVAVRVVEPETRRRLPVGEKGLLLVRGANVMMGYLDDEERTAAAIRDGWYATGDIASLDADGFVTIHDRMSRFSKIGGEMVPHECVEKEIEAILGPSPERTCVVTGVPDPRKGERLVAVCTRDVDLDMLYEHLRRSPLPNLWLPRRDSFMTIDKLPLLGSGKLDLTAIRKLAREAPAGGAAKSCQSRSLARSASSERSPFLRSMWA